MWQYLRCEIEGKVAIITINNPPINALSPDVTQEMNRMFVELKENSTIQAVILTGTGKAVITAAAGAVTVEDFLNTVYA